MDDFKFLLEVTLDILKTEFTLWGFTFSFWEVFVFAVIASVVCWIISYLLLGD